MLFAKEVKADHALMLHCMICEYSQQAEDKCVLKNDAATSSQVRFNFADVVADPTLPRASGVLCPADGCGNTEAVFMKDPGSKDTEGLTLYFICTACKHSWKPDLS